MARRTRGQARIDVACEEAKVRQPPAQRDVSCGATGTLFILLHSRWARKRYQLDSTRQMAVCGGPATAQLPSRRGPAQRMRHEHNTQYCSFDAVLCVTTPVARHAIANGLPLEAHVPPLPRAQRGNAVHGTASSQTCHCS